MALNFHAYDRIEAADRRVDRNRRIRSENAAAFNAYVAQQQALGLAPDFAELNRIRTQISGGENYLAGTMPTGQAMQAVQQRLSQQRDDTLATELRNRMSNVMEMTNTVADVVRGLPDATPEDIRTTITETFGKENGGRLFSLVEDRINDFQFEGALLELGRLSESGVIDRANTAAEVAAWAPGTSRAALALVGRSIEQRQAAAAAAAAAREQAAIRAYNADLLDQLTPTNLSMLSANPALTATLIQGLAASHGVNLTPEMLTQSNELLTQAMTGNATVASNTAIRAAHTAILADIAVVGVMDEPAQLEYFNQTLEASGANVRFNSMEEARAAGFDFTDITDHILDQQAAQLRETRVSQGIETINTTVEEDITTQQSAFARVLDSTNTQYGGEANSPLMAAGLNLNSEYYVPPYSQQAVADGLQAALEANDNNIDAAVQTVLSNPDYDIMSRDEYRRSYINDAVDALEHRYGPEPGSSAESYAQSEIAGMERAVTTLLTQMAGANSQETFESIRNIALQAFDDSTEEAVSFITGHDRLWSENDDRVSIAARVRQTAVNMRDRILNASWTAPPQQNVSQLFTTTTTGSVASSSTPGPGWFGREAVPPAVPPPGTNIMDADSYGAWLDEAARIERMNAARAAGEEEFTQYQQNAARYQVEAGATSMAVTLISRNASPSDTLDQVGQWVDNNINAGRISPELGENIFNQINSVIQSGGSREDVVNALIQINRESGRMYQIFNGFVNNIMEQRNRGTREFNVNDMGTWAIP